MKSLVESKPSPPEPGKKQPMCLDKARTATSLFEGVFIHGHLDNLLGSMKLGFPRQHRWRATRERWGRDMMVWEEEETMEEKVVDQVDSNNLEDT
jgi:hypothetical protein